jgi:hypothetical protein
MELIVFNKLLVGFDWVSFRIEQVLWNCRLLLELLCFLANFIIKIVTA